MKTAREILYAKATEYNDGFLSGQVKWILEAMEEYKMINITSDDNQLIEWVYTGQQEDYLLDLLSTSSFDDNQRNNMARGINAVTVMDESMYNIILRELLNNQLDRITSGLPYNQSDIKEHLKKLR